MWDSIFSGLGTVAQVAGTAFDIYQGFENLDLANKQMNAVGTSLAQNDAYTAALFDQQKKYWELENLQLQYTKEDIQNLRPAYENQVEYQGQRLNEQLEQAKKLNPTIDTAEIDLVNLLTQSEDSLSEQFRNEAAADINNAFSQQQAQDVRAMGLAGVNPNSGQFTNYMTQSGISQALGSAAAQTQATRNAESEYINRMSTALNYAKGAQLPTYNPQYNNTAVNSALGGVGTSVSANTGLAQMYNNNAQDNFTGASYLLNALSNGSVFNTGSYNGYSG